MFNFSFDFAPVWAEIRCQTHFDIEVIQKTSIDHRLIRVLTLDAKQNAIGPALNIVIQNILNA